MRAALKRLLALVLFLGMAPLAAWGQSAAPDASLSLPPAWTTSWKAGPEAYGVAAELDVPVMMSDGVELRAFVAYPTDPATGKRAAGRFPVLLEQSPYAFGMAQAGDPLASYQKFTRYYVSRGYIYVLAQVRGTHHSGGAFDLFSEREQADGVELVDWAAHRLSGSNGRIGLSGCSYTGINQYFTAARVGPNSPVKAMVPTGVGIYWNREPLLVGGMPTTSGEKALSDVLANNGTESAVRSSLALLAEVKAGGPAAYNRDYWELRSGANAIPKIVANGIPALIFSYWDDYPTSPLEAYAMFQNAAAGADPWSPLPAGRRFSPRYQVVMGAGPHCSGREAGGFMAEAALKWYDTWVKGANTGLAQSRTPLHAYELGAKRWVSGGAYPPVGRYQAYYMGASGELSLSKPKAAGGVDRMHYAPPMRDGATLTYTTASFPKGARLAGPIAATIYARTDRTNMSMIVDLIDVSADGKTTHLTTGALIASQRALDEGKTWRDADGRMVRPLHKFTRDDPLAPGDVTRLDIQIQPRWAFVAPGHKLRLVLKTQSDVRQCATPGLFPANPAAWCMSPTVPQRRALEGGIVEVQRNRKWASLINFPLSPIDAGN